MKKLFWGVLLLLISLPAFAVDKFENNRQVNCLALNIYFEAANQKPVGQYAVAFVTMNRVKTHKFPDTICDVVWQKKWGPTSRRWVAQFSWTLDGKADRPYNHKKNTNARWEMAKKIAKVVYEFGHVIPDPSKGATHYHAYYVTPIWARASEKLVTIGDHIFYL